MPKLIYLQKSKSAEIVTDKIGPEKKDLTQPPSEGKTADKPTLTLVKFDRNEAIRVGGEAGADVVVFGKYSELDGVLMLSAQARCRQNFVWRSVKASC